MSYRANHSLTRERRIARTPRIVFIFTVCLSVALTGDILAQTISTLHNFNGNSDGGNPTSDLILSGNTLYGTAFYGGDSVGNMGHGTMYQIDTDGSDFNVLHTFTNGLDGANPFASLVLSSNLLLGTTVYGTNANGGTVFAFDIEKTNFATLHTFTGYPGDGDVSNGALTPSGSTFFSVTVNGGIYDTLDGTVFQINADGSGYGLLHSFSQTYINNVELDSSGVSPHGTLVNADGAVYGTTAYGGLTNIGVIFGIRTNGSNFTVLHRFAPSDGGVPTGQLILSGNILYGTTQLNGDSDSGTVFAVQTNGSNFVVLHSFSATSGPQLQTNWDGANLNGGLLLIGNTLYGTALNGGQYGYGTIFQVNTDGSGFVTLHNFHLSDGANPYCTLIFASNHFYGTTHNGGSNGYGTLFSLTLPSLPAPRLFIAPSGTNVILTWTNSAVGYILQSTLSLTPAVWNDVATAPVVTNGQFTVTSPISSTVQFFRLYGEF